MLAFFYNLPTLEVMSLLKEISNNNVTGSNFEITFVSEKHMVEDDVLFTNHLVGK